MKLIHVITKNIDWSKMTYASFLKQDVSHFGHKKWSNIPSDMIEFVYAWDDTFGTSYFQFRDRLTKIARKTHAKVGFDDAIELKDMPQYNCEEECYFVISDDDDWYGPGLKSFLLSCNEDIVAWSDLRIDRHGKVKKFNARLPACGWALKGSTYFQNPKVWNLRSNPEGAKKSIAPHLQAHVILSKSKNLVNAKYPSCIHSLGIKTLASLQEFGKCLGDDARSKSKQYFDNWKRKYRPESPNISWGKEELDQLIDLHLMLDPLVCKYL